MDEHYISDACTWTGETRVEGRKTPGRKRDMEERIGIVTVHLPTYLAISTESTEFDYEIESVFFRIFF